VNLGAYWVEDKSDRAGGEFSLHHAHSNASGCISTLETVTNIFEAPKEREAPAFTTFFPLQLAPEPCSAPKLCYIPFHSDNY
jgi:hypothetical protein